MDQVGQLAAAIRHASVAQMSSISATRMLIHDRMEAAVIMMVQDIANRLFTEGNIICEVDVQHLQEMIARDATDDPELLLRISSNLPIFKSESCPTFSIDLSDVVGDFVSLCGDDTMSTIDKSILQQLHRRLAALTQGVFDMIAMNTGDTQQTPVLDFPTTYAELAAALATNQESSTMTTSNQTTGYQGELVVGTTVKNYEYASGEYGEVVITNMTSREGEPDDRWILLQQKHHGVQYTILESLFRRLIGATPIIEPPVLPPVGRKEMFERHIESLSGLQQFTSNQGTSPMITSNKSSSETTPTDPIRYQGEIAIGMVAHNYYTAKERLSIKIIDISTSPNDVYRVLTLQLSDGTNRSVLESDFRLNVSPDHPPQFVPEVSEYRTIPIVTTDAEREQQGRHEWIDKTMRQSALFEMIDQDETRPSEVYDAFRSLIITVIEETLSYCTTTDPDIRLIDGESYVTRSLRFLGISARNKTFIGFSIRDSIKAVLQQYYEVVNGPTLRTETRLALTSQLANIQGDLRDLVNYIDEEQKSIDTFECLPEVTHYYTGRIAPGMLFHAHAAHEAQTVFRVISVTKGSSASEALVHSCDHGNTNPIGHDIIETKASVWRLTMEPVVEAEPSVTPKSDTAAPHEPIEHL